MPLVGLPAPPRSLILTGDATISATSFTDVPGLMIALSPGIYDVRLWVHGITGSTGGSGLDIQLVFTGGSTNTSFYSHRDLPVSQSYPTHVNGTGLFQGSTGGVGAANSEVYFEVAQALTATTAGVLSVQAEQSTSNGILKALETRMMVSLAF